ncbi:MAG: hypothetical protein BGO52_13475 [Sphingobacteriales bacterium 44-61]|nr:MAG: hypothetical protein BGO52_13475 [Sphingobacteriales bacterium 44-61]
MVSVLAGKVSSWAFNSAVSNGTARNKRNNRYSDKRGMSHYKCTKQSYASKDREKEFSAAIKK